MTTSVNKNIIEITDNFEKQNISKTKQFICEFAKCDRIINFKLKLKSQLFKAHSVKRLKCNSCNFETNLMSAFIKHKNSRKHSRIGKDPYVCSLNGCDKSLNTKSLLNCMKMCFIIRIIPIIVRNAKNHLLENYFFKDIT